MYKSEREIVELLRKRGRMGIEEIASAFSLQPDNIRRAIESLKAKNFLSTVTEETLVLQPTEEYRRYVSEQFPEYSVYLKSLKSASVDTLSPDEKNIGVRWARTKGFVDIENGILKPTKEETDVNEELKRLKDAFNQIEKTGRCDQLIEDELFKRRLVTKKIIRKHIFEYTGKPLEELEEEFDLNVTSKDAEIGKPHPISCYAERIREIMAELGFEEMEGTLLESAFWNFDALFQPQDHPARELADTFYVELESKLPEDKELVARVKRAHENGWKYKWDEKIAKKTVLRTHTTCLSARYLAGIKDRKPRKYFAIGRVFRNEATDFKHLAEFHQIEGIVAWEKATFRDLLGILKEVYKKLGFEKIRFRPSYFPYTEPSLEVEVFFDERKEWLELGGAGIFRPEVSLPLCGIYPVLAWGLSLERPLMLALDLKDIREFYKNDLEFLRNIRLKI
ncbi:MAG: phenylalanine--tRNA ligase subunit alpha [Candidatus Bilamarchaeaceae archaeon]